MSAISNFVVPKRDSGGIRKNGFGFLNNDFRTQNLKFDVKIMVLGHQILILANNFRNEICEKSKFQNLAELLSHFVFQ